MYRLTREQELAEAVAKHGRFHPPVTKKVAADRPKLTTETVIDYLDWLTANIAAIDKDLAAVHMAAAELVIRVHMGNAQGKATAHSEALPPG